MKALLIVMGLGGVAMAAPTADEVLANTQTYYAKADHLRAAFKQVATNTTFGKETTTQGNVYAAKPTNVRFDYLSAKGVITKTFAFDGKTAWMVDRPNKTLYKQPVAGTSLPAAVSFLTGGTLAKQFTVSFDTSGAHGAKGATVLKLLPRQASAAYKELYFIVEPGDWHIRESVVVASNGDTTTYSFYSPDLKTEPGAGLFTIDPKSVPGFTVRP